MQYSKFLSKNKILIKIILYEVQNGDISPKKYAENQPSG